MMNTLADLCKQKVLEEIGGLAWLRKYITIPKSSTNGEIRMECIIHDDSTPSLQFNTNSGLWQCFGCDAKGDLIDFWYHLGGKYSSKHDAIRALAIDLKLLQDITDDTVQQLVERFWKPGNERCIQLARDWFNVSDETLRKFQIGLHVYPKGRSARISFPVKGRSGYWEDIRLYHKEDENKVISWAKGHGGCRVWPYSVLQNNDIVVIFEGEKDTLRAQDFGITNAICFTAGCKNVPPDAHDLFIDKTVYICYDVDDQGRDGADHAANVLALTASEVRIITLPREALPQNGDFSDWANLGKNMDDWRALVVQSFKVDPPDGYHQQEVTADEDYREIDLARITTAGVYNEPIRFQARATGVSVGLPQYQVPESLVANCPRNQKICKKCRLFDLDPLAQPWELNIDHKSEQSLQLFRCSGDTQDRTIRKMFGIHHECRVVQIKPKSRIGVQNVICTPPVDLSEMRDSYNASGRLTAYYHGSLIEDNRDYYFYGYLQPDPKSQMGVLNLHRADPARNAIDTFTLNQEVLDAVEWFQPEEGQSIYDHIDELHRIIEKDICIWGRHDIQHAVLETMLSALEFYLGGRRIRIGWIETLVIGDSRTGKSEVAKRMMAVLNLGEYISGEMVSIPGLIGGIEQVDKVGIIKWGAWPRNDRGFMVLDELDEMTGKKGDMIGQLSALRSDGMARVTKIMQGARPARTRVLWITNARGGRKIATFNGGVQAITTIIDSLQDIARFTKCYAVWRDGMDIKVLTQIKPEEWHPKRHFWNTLAILVWSLKAHQISFTDEAVSYLQEHTERLILKYHDSIPLVESGSMLEKLARLSIPTAALCGSFERRNDEMHLQVTKEHAEYTVWHLKQTYDAPAMRYDQYSAMMFAAGQIDNEDEVLGALASNPDFGMDPAPMIRFFMSRPNITFNHFNEFVGDRHAATRIWSVLLKNNCLEHDTKSDYSQKTQAFAHLLEREMKRAKT